MKLILASGSPRRCDILRQIGVTFTIERSHVAEQIDPTLSPGEMIQQLALQKALAVAANHQDGLVLGADTVVVHNHALMGKPRDAAHAAEMLRSLSGQWHQVMTAVAIVDASGMQAPWLCVETTEVKFRTLTEAEIAAYIQTGESMDKAGAYGIQGYGALLVEQIHGCYLNVVGLPVQIVARGLQNWGMNLYEYQHMQQNQVLSTV